jgi:hypothetical protein
MDPSNLRGNIIFVTSRPFVFEISGCLAFTILIAPHLALHTEFHNIFVPFHFERNPVLVSRQMNVYLLVY